VHGFYGDVQLEGENVPDGTLITAMIGSQIVATTETESSRYTIMVAGDFTDETVRLFVGGELVPAMESVTWRAGDFWELNLHAYSSYGKPAVSGLYGIATTDGKPASPGIEVNAWIDGDIVKTTEIQTYGGTSVYSLTIPGAFSGETVDFSLGGCQCYTAGPQWVAGNFVSFDLHHDWEPCLYDVDRNETIDYPEMVSALMDYLLGSISYSQMVQVLMLYLIA